MSTSWRLDLPEGWVAWQPGSPDIAAIQAAATTGRRAARTLARRVAVAEKEAPLLPGQVHQIGVRVADPGSGQVSASMFLTQWARPTQDGKQLNARRHLTAVEERGADPSRSYQYREASIEQVPAGQLVLRNEVWRPRRRLGWHVTLETTIFPRETDVMFELTVNSRYGELQPELMAEISLMAHSFRLDAPT